MVSFFARVGADDSETCAAVAERLADKSADVRSAAVRFFAEIGAEDPGIRTAFTQRLADENPGVRSAAVSFFAEIGAYDSDTRAAIAEGLADKDAHVHFAAVSFFAGQDPDPAMALRLFNALSSASGITWSMFDRQISEMIGTAAGTDHSLVALILQKGRTARRLDLDHCLRHAALERDRLRREREPLDLSI